MTISRRKFLAAGTGLAGLVLDGQARLAFAAEDAASFPSKHIKMILPYTAGGAPDLLARTLQGEIERVWKKTLIVDSKPGANGIIACNAVTNAPPDGYTLIMGSVATHAINASFQEALSYDPIKGFAPVTLIGTTPLIITGRIDLPVKTLAELIAYCRANPNKLTYSSVGNGSLGHLAAELFSLETGVKMVHVPYKGVSQASLDLVSGHVDLSFSNIPNVLEFIKVGKLRPFAVTSLERLSILPDVPAAAEIIPKFETTLWWGVFASGGTPRPIVDKLNSLMVQRLRAPDERTKWAAQGVTLTGSTPDELAAILKADTEKWAKAVKASREGKPAE
jgi:tripartite-type tricarboxylate transporter receptor subunit TctC